MSDTSATDPQKLVQLVAAIEQEAGPANLASQQDRRAARRERNLVHCEICLFHGNGKKRTIVDAATRNVTFHGLSVVVCLDQPVRRGRPAEVVVAMEPGSQTHLAGVVAFCREIEKSLYEIGVNVRASGPSAILMHDVEVARATYEWFAESLLCDETPEHDAPLEVGSGGHSQT